MLIHVEKMEASSGANRVTAAFILGVALLAGSLSVLGTSLVYEHELKEARTAYQCAGTELKALNVLLDGATSRSERYREEIRTLDAQVATLEKIAGVKVMDVTFYTHTGNPTATGAMPAAGRTIAVDPAVIPLGSIVYIEDIGWRVAEDTGGLIKGYKIDVFVDTKEEAIARGACQRFAIIKQ